MISLRYRSDIDGLRAVAVLGVVIYHAFPKVLPGGFSGVDIFFVISGYLISGILYKGHREGGFSFAEFYARRVRRLFPALIVMLVLTLLLGYRLLLKNEFEELGRQVASGMLFVQNFLFWQESGYFDRAGELKPLLHLWSLAIEEQFYLIFPPILILLGRRKSWLVAVIATMCLGSLILNCLMSVQNPNSDFYMIPYRAWEFLGGSLLAWWHYDKGYEQQVPAFSEVMSLGGLILLGTGMVLIRSGDPYPGWRALIPVTGTLLLIEGGEGAWVNRKILSHPAVIWVGLISYPLYLFHWPLLSFTRITQGKAPDVGMTLLALCFALLASVATYYLVERQIRLSRSRWTVPLLVGLFLGVGVFGSLCAFGILLPRSSNLGYDSVILASMDNDYFKGYSRTIVKSDYSIYRLGGIGPKTLFIGDSHMEQCAPRIRHLIQSGKAGERGAVFLTKGGSLPIPHVHNSKKDQEKGFSEEILNLGLSPDVDRVVITASWFYYFNWGGKFYEIHGHPLMSPEGRDDALENLAEVISGLSAKGKKVYLILGFPTSDAVDPLASVHRSLTGEFSIHPFHFYVSDFLQMNGLMPFSQAELMKKIENLAVASGAAVIKPIDALQKNGEFPWHDGLQPYYHDGSHFTATYMKENASFLDLVMTPSETVRP
jgi:peptidoglycan/LPS O-acetylase OafA/YrhL